MDASVPVNPRRLDLDSPNAILSGRGHRYHVRDFPGTLSVLLEETGRSVSEVCLDVGFQSLGSFSALFRRRFGVAPSRIRGGRRA